MIKKIALVAALTAALTMNVQATEDKVAEASSHHERYSSGQDF